MAYICDKPAGSCSKCPHCRYDYDEDRMACFAETDEAAGYEPEVKTPRKVIAMFEVNDALAEKLGFGTIDYFETCLGTMCTSGIEVIDSRILDDDDPEDTAAIKAADEIFNY